MLSSCGETFCKQMAWNLRSGDVRNIANTAGCKSSIWLPPAGWKALERMRALSNRKYPWYMW